MSSLCVVDKGCVEDDLLQLSASHLQCVIVPFKNIHHFSSWMCHPNLYTNVLQFSLCSSAEALHLVSLHMEFIAHVAANTGNGYIPYRKPGKVEALGCLETPTGGSVPHK